jgi:flagellar hook-length control protein FliK
MIAVDAALPGNKGVATAPSDPTSLCAGLERAFEQRGEMPIGFGGDAKPIAGLKPDDPLETDTGWQLQGSFVDTGTAALLALNPLQSQRELPPGTPSLLAQSSPLPALATTSTQPGSPDLATSTVAGAKLPHPAGKPDGAAVLNDLAAGFTLEATGKAGKLQKDATARLTLGEATLATPAESTGHTDTRNILAAAKLTEVSLTPIATPLAMTNTATPARRDERTRDGSIFRTNLNEGTAIVPSYLPSTSNAVTPGAPDSLTATDMYVAEKVAYWISNDVQNAEMKLDGIGVDPVEVSIRMQGNEAHISFRTDELQARAALENAGVHLKDMLQREGLTLSGVSVGTSDAGGAGEQERRSRQGGKQSTVASVQSAPAGRSAVLHRITGGSLDLFV